MSNDDCKVWHIRLFITDIRKIKTYSGDRNIIATLHPIPETLANTSALLAQTW